MLTHFITLFLYLIAGAIALFGAFIGMVGLRIAFEGGGVEQWIGQVLTFVVFIAIAFGIHKLAQHFYRKLES